MSHVFHKMRKKCNKTRKNNIFQRAYILKRRTFFKHVFFLIHFYLCLAGGYRRQPESFVSNDKVTIRRSSQEPDSIRPL